MKTNKEMQSTRYLLNYIQDMLVILEEEYRYPEVEKLVKLQKRISKFKRLLSQYCISRDTIKILWAQSLK